MHDTHSKSESGQSVDGLADTAAVSPVRSGRAGLAKALRSTFRAAFESLAGQLLWVTLGFLAVGLILVYFMTAAVYRQQWMMERIEAAHLTALAADLAPGNGPGDMDVRTLLRGADAIAVARVRGGMNELVLYGGPIDGPLVESDLRTAGFWTHVTDTIDTLFAPDGRYLRIRAYPENIEDDAPEEVLDVIVVEAPLKTDLQAYTRRFWLVGIFVGLGGGAVVYGALFAFFVRPMRGLAGAMVRFSADPDDPDRMIRPTGRPNEIGQAEQELADMQADIRLALRERERLAALGAAVAKINHDLRNVLTSAQLVSDRLAGDSDPRVRGMGERLVRAVDRGVRLCEATLAFGRADETPPDPEWVVVSDLLDEAAGDAMMSEGQVAWSNHVELDLELSLDADQAHRIFLNLFRNAIQAMRDAALREPDRDLALSARAERVGEIWRIEIEDTGPGLPRKAQDNLFQAFTGSSRKGGTGLGLAIARELSRAHEGELELVSTGPRGTVFAVCLPDTARRD